MSIRDRSTLTDSGIAMESMYRSAFLPLQQDCYRDNYNWPAKVVSPANPASSRDLYALQNANENLEEGISPITPKFSFRAYILNQGSPQKCQSPHAFFEDPCGLNTSAPPECVRQLIQNCILVTSPESYAGPAPQIGDTVTIMLHQADQHGAYDLQFAQLVSVANSSIREATNFNTREACESLKEKFEDPLVVGSVGGARSIAEYEERYSYACRVSSPYDAKIRALAARLGIEPAVIYAFRAIESGNLPPNVLRFEPHVFIRNRSDLTDQIPYTRGDSPGGCPESRNGACVGFVSYTSTETGQGAFDHAFSLDPAIAIKSSSFGLFQIVGFNFPSTASPAIANYQTDPQAFLDYMNKDPVAFSFEIVEVWFLANAHAIHAAKTHDWLTLAMIYNGHKAAAQDYQLKLEAAYNVAARDCDVPAVAAAN